MTGCSSLDRSSAKQDPAGRAVAAKTKLLVAIASHGTGNDRYLAELVREYRSMPYDVDIVVFSDIPKEVAPGVRVIVGLPSENPWSLPFAHKRILAEGLNDHDLFVYSEDDILIQERNIRAFLRVAEVLREDEIAGFLRSEKGRDGETCYPEFHGCYHWDSESVRSRGEYTFAFFTNEHAGCYLLTRRQLKRAIESGGFLVKPHQGRQDLACSAATDPYTQCGFRKLICISHPEDFVVSHLSNRYAGTWMSLERADFCRQLEALLRVGRNGNGSRPLFATETRLPGLKYSKSYYEPLREEIFSLIPASAQSLLSVGCGWGATEGWLVRKGVSVAAVPLDSVIGACAEARGVEIISEDFAGARERLAGRKFDCVFISNVLHLVKNPVEVLSSFAGLLSDKGVVVSIVPNLAQIAVLWRRFRGDPRVKGLGTYEGAGLHWTSHRVVRKWFNAAGLGIENLVGHLPGRAQTAHRVSLGLMDPLLATEVVAVARRD